jgi:hypothetical protein
LCELIQRANIVCATVDGVIEPAKDESAKG